MSSSNLQKTPVFEDILVTSRKANDAGEFCSTEKSNESFIDLHDRLLKQIKYLAEQVADFKSTGTFKRLITNEFFFYTKNPLTEDQFQKLMQSIMDMAINLPSNLHLILGSFAVKGLDDIVMNVVPYIQCGTEDTNNLNLIVKKYPTVLDPVFYQSTSPMPNAILNAKGVNNPQLKETKADVLEKRSIIINGKSVPFSYKNNVNIKIGSKRSIVCCIDICLDHVEGNTKKELYNYLKNLFSNETKSEYKLSDQTSASFLCNHVIISNSIRTKRDKCLYLEVTHCDPDMRKFSWVAKLQDQSKIDQEIESENAYFGTAYRVRTQVPVSAYDLRSDLLIQLIRDKLNVNVYLNAMKELKDFNINMPDSHGCPPLAEAIIQGDLKIAKKMIDEFNADCKSVVNYFSNNSYTLDTINFLIEKCQQLPKIKDELTELKSKVYSELLINNLDDSSVVEHIIGKFKEEKELNINTVNAEGQLPLLEAIRGNSRLAESMIKDCKADCSFCFKHMFSEQMRSRASYYFYHFFKIPELKDAIDLQVLAENSKSVMLLRALIEGIPYKGTLQEIKEIKDESCRNLLLKFNEFNKSVNNIKLEYKGDNLADKIKNFFLECSSKPGLFPGLTKDQIAFIDTVKNSVFPKESIENFINMFITDSGESKTDNDFFIIQLLHLYRNLPKLLASASMPNIPSAEVKKS